jgi:MFS family permease
MMTFYRQNARWLLGGFLLACFSGFGQTFYISIWGAEIREEFQLTHGGFGIVYMIATLASAAVLPFVGRLVDVVSVSITSIIVIIMLALATVIMSQAESMVGLFSAIFLLRLFGQGMMTHTAVTAMARWYANNRGKAVSIATIGHQFSEALGPTIFVTISLSFGWRESWLFATATLLLLALPVIYFLMRVERKPLSHIVNKHTEDLSKRQWTRLEMLKDRYFWLTGIGVFSPAFIGTSIFFHQDYLIDVNGWSPELYYSSFALMAITTVCVSLLTGFAVDRWSAVRLLPIFMVPLGLSCLVLGLFSTPSTIFIFMILLGCSYGMSSTLFGAIWPEVYGIRYLGSLRAVIVSMMVFMSAVGPGITGFLIDVGIPFNVQLIYIGSFCFFTVLLMLLSSRAYRERLKLNSVI